MTRSTQANSPTPANLRAGFHRFGLERDRLRAALSEAARIPQNDLDALEHLEADGPLTQRELGQRLALTSGGVTVLIDRLERRGWVKRMPHPSDRRAVLLELTPTALDDMPEAMSTYHDGVAQAIHAIPPGARPAVAALLAAVTEAAADATMHLKKRLG